MFADEGKQAARKAVGGNRHRERNRNILNSLHSAQRTGKVVRERYKRYEQIENRGRAERCLADDADIVIAAYGTTARIAKNAVLAARAKGIKVGLIRPITLWPFPKNDFAGAAKTARAFLSVEMSMGQMVDDVRLAINCSRPVGFFGRTGGVVPTPAEMLAEIEKIAGGVINA